MVFYIWLNHQSSFMKNLSDCWELEIVLISLPLLHVSNFGIGIVDVRLSLVKPAFWYQFLSSTALAVSNSHMLMHSQSFKLWTELNTFCAKPEYSWHCTLYYTTSNFSTQIDCSLITDDIPYYHFVLKNCHYSFGSRKPFPNS